MLWSPLYLVSIEVDIDWSTLYIWWSRHVDAAMHITFELYFYIFGKAASILLNQVHSWISYTNIKWIDTYRLFRHVPIQIFSNLAEKRIFLYCIEFWSWNVYNSWISDVGIHWSPCLSFDCYVYILYTTVDTHLLPCLHLIAYKSRLRLGTIIRWSFEIGMGQRT